MPQLLLIGLSFLTGTTYGKPILTPMEDFSCSEKIIPSHYQRYLKSSLSIDELLTPEFIGKRPSKKSLKKRIRAFLEMENENRRLHHHKPLPSTYSVTQQLGHVTQKKILVLRFHTKDRYESKDGVNYIDQFFGVSTHSIFLMPALSEFYEFSKVYYFDDNDKIIKTEDGHHFLFNRLSERQAKIKIIRGMSKIEHDFWRNGDLESLIKNAKNNWGHTEPVVTFSVGVNGFFEDMDKAHWIDTEINSDVIKKLIDQNLIFIGAQDVTVKNGKITQWGMFEIAFKIPAWQFLMPFLQKK